MARHKKLTEAEWQEVFELRCKSKAGGKLSQTEQTLVEDAFKENEDRYASLEIDVFNATAPFGSSVPLKKD